MTGCAHFKFSAASREVRELGLGAAALVYAELGYAVLPIQRGGKKPNRILGDSGGVHHASLDAGQIRAWWGAGDRGANIGVACGAASRLLVFDLDVKNGDNGPAELQRFLADGALPFPWPGSPWAQTASGGLHVWLRTYDFPHLPCRNGALPGVDVKGDGGYVCAPPSMLAVTDRASGETVPVPYTWCGCPCSVPPAPAWVPGWLARNPGSAVAGQGSGEVPGQDELEARGVQAGQRNEILSRHAARLFRRFGTTPSGEDAVRQRLGAIVAGPAFDRRDFGGRELDVIIASARRFIGRQED